MPDKQIKIGDIVYRMKSGWSGVPMEVLELADGCALCKGVKGWNVNGLYSTKYGVYVERYHLSGLTHEPNSRLGNMPSVAEIEPENSALEDNEPEETYWTHPSLTNGERNPGLTRRRY